MSAALPVARTFANKSKYAGAGKYFGSIQHIFSSSIADDIEVVLALRRYARPRLIQHNHSAFDVLGKRRASLALAFCAFVSFFNPRISMLESTILICPLYAD